MANPTTYFAWVMPNSADLVTDLPADFAVFGQGVDTSMSQLLGGTTGQVLSKTSGTNMAFTWINNDTGDITGVTAGTGISGGGTSGTVTVSIDTATTVDKTTAQTLTNKTLTSPALTTPTISTATTNGDILYGTGSGALARLGIGSSAQVLTVASGIPAWAAPAGGGKVLQVLNTTLDTPVTTSSSSAVTTTLSQAITPSLATSKVLIMVNLNGIITTGAGARYYLYKNGSLLKNISSNGSVISGRSLNFLDSPATTSATTYAIFFSTVSGTAYLNDYMVTSGDTISAITTLEIGA